MFPGERSQPTGSRHIRATIIAASIAVALTIGVGGVVNHAGAYYPSGLTGSAAKCRGYQNTYNSGTATQGEKAKAKEQWDANCTEYGNIWDTRPLPKDYTVKIVAPTPTPAKFAPPLPVKPR